MRVAIIINHLGFGGAERLAVDEANELYRRGIPVVLVTLRPERPTGNFSSLCELPSQQRRYILFRSLYDVRGYVALVSFLRSEKITVMVSHLWFANTIARIAAFFARIPTRISFEHNVYDHVKTRKQFFIDRILQRLSTHIVAVSQAVQDSLVHHGITAERIVVIPNGIDVSRYKDAQPADVRNEKHIGNAFTFLFIGRLIHQKGVDILLNAFAQVPKGHLLIVGTGIEQIKLEQQAHDLDIANRVSFLGARTDIPVLFKSVDCFVLPSRHEGMPIVLIEALATGIPIVVSDFASAREVVEDDVSAIVVPMQDSTILANALNRIRSDERLRSKLSENALQASQRFSITHHVDKFLKIA